MRARSAGELPSCSIRRASSSTSRGATTKPSTPSRTTEPAAGVTTLGSPQASASYVTTAEPSKSDGNTKTSAAAIRAGISAWATRPSSST